MSKLLLPFSLVIVIAAYTIPAAKATSGFSGLDDPYASGYVLAIADTIPLPGERYGDFINDPNNNPFDLNDPSAIEKDVEYDPETGMYIVTERIGDDYFRPPTYMTFDQYMEYRRKKEERDYFNSLAGINTEGTNLSAVDPIAKFDVQSSLIDRLFGGNTVDIRPQGGIDLTFGVDFQRLENPILTERQRTQGGFDFDMDIQMNVTGKIGEKLNLTTNYNTNATFDFDNQIKLDYNSDLFSEDEIIKKIEAGNVSLPLRGSLIQGAQSLFGLKTELQFGRLWVTAIASQQKSQRENIQLQGGSQLQEFEVKADEYDENRHFFLSHYNRDSYEQALRNLPQINTLFHLENIEVWITNDRNEVTDVRDIVALADLGEPTRLVNPEAVPQFQTPRYREICDGKPLPDNGANGLYSKLLNREGLRDIDQAVSVLQSAEFGLQQARDFEKVSARKLDPREYTVHPELGYISVNINVQPDQVLGVAFQYKYNGEIFKVGELSVNTDDVSTDTARQDQQVLFVKMLKSTTQRTDVPTWDLMMKNVYSIGAYQVNPEDFKLDVFYEDPGEGQKRFLPASNLAGKPLIRVLNLDNLNTQNDPQPDGVFDFVPGVTINPINGRIMFPVLEPFGSFLAAQIDDPAYVDTFTYQELYDLTLFQAREFPEKNRYAIRGSYKSSVSSEISLGAFNIPPGSVRVTAGGTLLLEGRDYEVDYSTGKVRILNDAILSSGVPINVSFEDNTLFGFQSKTMLGLRAEYRLDDNFQIGATFLQLFERPFTQKVNIGDDPINNKIYGLDVNLSRDAPWLTRAVDAIPGLSTTQPSSISFSAEAAYLKPGHSRAINESKKDKDGVNYLDDFEGSASSFDLRTPVTNWYLASVPQNDAENNNPLFPEANVLNSLVSGANRAKLNWYRIDPSARSGVDAQDTYTSLVPQQEVFPNIQLPADVSPNIQTLDLLYSPGARGPYNFDTPEGFGNLTRGVSFVGDSLILRDPETRWGGIMRALTTNDFQSANIEFLEFWMLSPFLDPQNTASAAEDIEQKQGTLYINLGNISEDILKDSRKFFENGLPSPANPERQVDTTIWSVVPRGQQITRAFDNDEGTREIQDVGLDGLNDEGERAKFSNYLNAIRAANPQAAAKIEQDPSADNFRYYNDNSFPNEAGVRKRYCFFNNPEGNSQAGGDSRLRTSGTNTPDAEDLNQDNTLNETESYFQYEVPLRYDPIDPRRFDLEQTPFITDQIEDPISGRIWYRFRIPLNGPQKKSVGGILDFRSIRFMRMYMRGFETDVILRFARLELVRNQWRRYTRDLSADGSTVVSCDDTDTNFDVDAVNIEENSQRMPFNYTLPEGIQREQSLGVFNALQNEQSLSMRIDNLCDGDAKAIFKIVETDMRLFDRLKMFVHAESPDNDVPDGELRMFIRLGSDFINNYYEYEVPLVMSDPDAVAGIESSLPAYKNEVWRIENEFDFPLEILKELKKQRNAVNADKAREFSQVLDPTNPDQSHVIKVRGNPNLGYVKVAMIGVRNPKNDLASYSAEVWVNELRLVGMDERGGAAALARLDMQLADFGSLTFSGNFNTVGFGALDNQLYERSRERIMGYDVATNLQLGKFFPETWGLRLPFYGQLSNTTKTPEYDPYDLDIKLDEKLDIAETAEQKDSLKAQAQEVVNIKTYNFTNVRKERTGAGDGKPMPWDIENFSVSYSYTETERRDPIIDFENEREYTGALDYSYSRGGGYIEPFKGIKSKYLKLLSEFNFNPLPNSFNFSTVMNRQFSRTRYRFAGVDERFNTFFNKRFTWDRDYDVQWDITKSLKFGFHAAMISTIDEPDEIRLLESNIPNVDQYRRDSIWSSISEFGRPKNYLHSFNLSYNLPIRFVPFLDWVQVRAQYQAEYGWSAAALNVDSLGNVIQNSQNRTVNADLNFEKLYDQIPFLKRINRPANNRNRGRSNTRTPAEEENDQTRQRPQDDRRREQEASPLARALVRPLLLIRGAKFTYSERFRTVVPGFTPQASLLGQSPGFEAPGWGFVAGLQPKIRTLNEFERRGAEDWLYQNRNWITDNVFLNQDVLQDYTQAYSGQLTLEPFTDFRIDIEADRSFTENYSETFKNLDKEAPSPEFSHAVPTNRGQLSVSYSALSTMFRSKTSEVIALFHTFEDYRLDISQRIGTGLHEDPNLAEQGYTQGYGPNQQDVLIPAFIAAYTDQDPNTMDLNLFDILPKPNWRMSYNGLSRLPWFREVFSNLNITHGFQGTLTVGSYRTGLDYLDNLDVAGRSIDTVSYNFYPRLEIPDVSIQEAFAPLLAIEATLQNGMSFTADYKRSRTLALSATSKLLSESRSKEIVLGFGYLLRELDIAFLTGSKKKKSNRGTTADPNTPQANQATRPNRGGGQLQAQDLDIQFNFSLRDDITLAQKLDGPVAEPTRGNFALTLSPSAEYKLNRRLSLRLFFDYRRTVPKTSAGYPRTDTAGGLVVRFQLN